MSFFSSCCGEERKENRIIVVTGATGTNGRDVARALSSRKGVIVRLLVRDTNANKAQQLTQFGQLVQGDLDNPVMLDAAFKDADALFLLVPFAPNALKLASNAIEAAKRQGVKFVLAFSAQGANKDSNMWMERDHGQKEEVVKASGIPYAIVQPTHFMSNLLQFNRATLESQSCWYGSSGGISKYCSIDPVDTAEVSATILTSPSNHVGKTYELTGADPVSDNELANLASQAWGKSIKYVDVEPDTYLKNVKGTGMPDDLATSLYALQQIIRSGSANQISPAVEQILGRKPRTWMQYLTDNKL